MKAILESECPDRTKPEFRFELTNEAAEWNYLVLKKYNFDFKSALEANSSSPLGYGSEFRDPSTLEPLFKKHPFWNRLKLILERGSDWQLEELEEEKRRSDLQEALAFGNHKGATKQPEQLKQLITNDINYGFAMVVPLSKIANLPHVCMAPLNVAPQHSIDEYGNVVEKDRLTHDQSWKWGSETSVNSRVKDETNLPCIFGHALNRLINKTVALRLKYPNARIFCSKMDYKSAFRRMHLNWLTALRSCTQLPEEDIAIIALRLTFGGRSCPPEWGALSESVCDLTNALLSDPDWDPDELFSPAALRLPSRRLLGDDEEFGKARKLAIDVPVDDCYCDVYIDDKVSIGVDLPGTKNVTKVERGALLAIETTARPLMDSEPIPRHMMPAQNKFEAESAAEELKVVLGWHFNFRGLRINLPDNKFIAWSNDIKVMLETKSSRAKELESCIGRMGHIGRILPMINHFLSGLRCLKRKAEKRRSIKIPERTQADCRLLFKFLDKAKAGVSMNLVSYRLPNKVYRSDSCPHGLGGYSHEGWAWRFYLPENLLYRASNNLLEHIACIITVWIDILAGRTKPEDCLLSMTDSSTSAGWCVKSNFDVDPLQEADCYVDPIEAQVREEVCQHFGLLLLENDLCQYSQWFPGKDNHVSDALSRDDDRTDEELTHLLRTFVPEQIPDHFQIVPLPNEIVSWLTVLLLKMPVKEQLQERRSRTKIGRGGDGKSTQIRSESEMTSSSTDSPNQTESRSWEPLPWLCVKGDFRSELMLPWLKAQSEIPFRLWHRPSGTTTDQIQPRTMTASLADFYQGYSEHLETKIQRRNNRKHSQQQS